MTTPVNVKSGKSINNTRFKFVLVYILNSRDFGTFFKLE